MKSADVVDFYSRMEKLGIPVWIDGGWCVDALVGEQTRPHGDLDIFVEWKNVKQLRESLDSLGFREIKLEIARPFNFVLADAAGREIDIHVFEFDGDGYAVYGSGEDREVFPAETFAGAGSVDGLPVRCISPEWTLKFHTGFKHRESDRMDVAALCRKFGLEYPEEYRYLLKSVGER